MNDYRHTLHIHLNVTTEHFDIGFNYVLGMAGKGKAQGCDDV